MDQISPFVCGDAARPAVIIGEQEICYGRFEADINAFATWLANNGVATGQHIGIYVNHSYWNWVCHLASIRMGLALATLTQNFREQARVLRPFDVALGEFGGANEPEVAQRRIVFSPRSMAPFAEQMPAGEMGRCQIDLQAAGNAKRLVYTSGTTGTSKVVGLNAGMLRSRVELVKNGQRLTETTRLLSLMGIDTIGGFTFPLATWQAGGCVLLKPFVPEARHGEIPTGLSNLLLVAPSRLQKLLSISQKTWAGSTERRIIVGGSRLPIQVRDAALARACSQISMIYGSTETSSIATGDARLLDRHQGAVGVVVEGADIQIVDQEDHPKPAGEKGIVRIRIRHMVHGYEGDSENESNSMFREGWFYPGDEGMLFEDGLLAITGRISESLNLGGLKISLLDYEAELLKRPEIQDACALVLKLDAGDRLTLAIVCDDMVDLQALAQQIKPRLPVKAPFSLLRVPGIPRNAMGKIPRIAFAEKLAKIYQKRVMNNASTPVGE